MQGLGAAAPLGPSLEKVLPSTGGLLLLLIQQVGDLEQK